MQIYGMEKTLIDIQNIRNITSIILNDFLYSDNKSEKMELIPILSVYYNGGQSIVLTSRDKYFDTFVKKVTGVYNDEKNNIIEDSLTDPFKLRSHIVIDEHTKEVLEKGTLTNINDIYKDYSNKYSYDNSLLFQKDEFMLLTDIVKYHIENLFSKTDLDVRFYNGIQGYRDNYLARAKVDGLDKNIIINYYKEGDNEYSFVIGGIFDNCNSINMNIKFKKDRIEVIIQNEQYGLYSEYTYLTNNGNIKQIVNINRKDKPVIYENRDLIECDNNIKSVTELDSKTEFKWFMLPWGALYGINNEVEDLGENEKIVKTYSMYAYVRNNSFMKKENYSKTYKKNSTSALKTHEVVIDDMLKNTLCICLSKEDKLYMIETSFLDSSYPNGYYQEKLQNRYFYHVIESENGIEGILLDNGINIDKETALSSADIKDTDKMIKLIRGNK